MEVRFQLATSWAGTPTRAAKLAMVSPSCAFSVMRRSTTSGAKLMLLLLATALEISVLCQSGRGTIRDEPARTIMRGGMRLISRSCSSVAPTCSAAWATVMVVGAVHSVQLARRLLPRRARFSRKRGAASQGNRMRGVSEAITIGLLREGLSALKSSTLISARRAAMLTSMSREILTWSK